MLFAGRVTACELFKPMAAAARRAIEANGYGHAATVVAKRSSDLVQGVFRRPEPDNNSRKICKCHLDGGVAVWACALLCGN